MSHFLLAVLHEEWQDVDELLEPYSEQLETEPRLKYTKAEAIQHGREHYKELAGKTDEECWKFMADGYTTDEDGNLYTTYNPLSKWDYYDVGGGWKGYLRLKNGEHTNSAKVSEIDFSSGKEDYKKALRFWDIVVEHAPAKPEENYFSIYGEKYFRDFYGDRETYARRQAMFSTYAVVTPDGEWHECGRMGWWGTSDETPETSADWDEHYFERFIKNAAPNLIMTIVDCHI